MALRKTITSNMIGLVFDRINCLSRGTAANTWIKVELLALDHNNKLKSQIYEMNVINERAAKIT